MALRGDKSADYNQARNLLSNFESSPINSANLSLSMQKLGTLHYFWPRAIDHEKSLSARPIVDQTSAHNEQLSLTQRLVAIVAPNVEHIRSRVLSEDEINNDFFVWLDSVLSAVDSPMAGQFMLPIKVAKARQSVHDSASTLIRAISEMDPVLLQAFLLSLAVKAGFPANIPNRAKVGTDLAEKTLDEVRGQLKWLEHLAAD